jgi:hypothetical protein
MTIKIQALSGVRDKGKLNQEWLLVVNESQQPFNMAGCSITVSRKGGRPTVATTIKAGLVLQGGERCRLVSGSSGKKSHGETLEEEGVRNFHLYLKAPYLERTGATIRLTSRQRELARAVFDPGAEDGIRKEQPPQEKSE